MEKLAKKVFVALTDDGAVVVEKKDDLADYDGAKVGIYEVERRGVVEVSDDGKVKIVVKKK